MLDPQDPLSSFSSFGDLLKFLRRRAWLSQRELSIAVGYSESQISRLESNQRVPDRTSLLALFVPALHIQDEPKTIARLLELAAAKPVGTTKEPDREVKPQHNLPTQLTSFIGRKGDLADLRRVLSDPQARLVTLTGEGGCGKTRLALQVGSELVQEYEHGVWLVEFGSLFEPGFVLNVVCSAFGLHASADQPLITLLTDFMLSKELLLVLDNCEHLIEAIAQMAERLLQVCPRLQILATSREVLGIPGEAIFRVLPLSLPPAQRGVLPSRAHIEPYEATQLFVARARYTFHSFELSDQNAPMIARVCQRLDGIPLALELAATWVNTLSVEGIADRLEESFDLLISKTRTGILPQHHSLHTAIAWSYNLLTEAEQALLRRLSAFAGSWSLEAAEAVASGSFGTSPPIARKQVLNLLNSLVNKSLIFVDPSESLTTRYRLLETIREYLQEKVTEMEEMDWLQNQHFEYFCKLAETAEPELKTKNQNQWMGRLLQEQGNFRLAFGYCQAQGKAEQGLRLAGALGHFWLMRGFDNESLKWFEATLQIASAEAGLQRSQLRAKVLLYLGLLFTFAESQEAEALWQECLSISRELEDAVLGGAALCFLGVARGGPHQLDEALSLFDESLYLLQKAEDDWWIAETLH